jgi:hypothetical protein
MADETSEAAASNAFDLEDRYVSSSIGDVNVKVGSWDNGNDFVSDSSRADGKFSANTTISGVKVVYDAANGTGVATTGNETVTVSV